MTEDTPIPRLRTPHGFEQANKMVADVGEHELAIRTNNAEFAELIKVHQDEIDKLKLELQELNIPHLLFIRQALPALDRWRKRNLKRYGKGRGIELPSGTLLREMDKNWIVETDGDMKSIIYAVRRRGLRFVTVAVSLNKRAIAANPSRFSNVNGLRIIKHDRFEVRPTTLIESENPKENRLRTVVETIKST